MSKVEEIFRPGGISFDGPNNYDPQIQNPEFLKRALANPSLCFGEAYMNGDWSVKSLDEMACRLTRNIESHDVENKFSWACHWLMAKLYNIQSKTRSKLVVDEHYNLGNDLYEAMLGKSMAYTCAYWKNASDLDTAQFAKYQLVCDKIYLQPGDRVLDIGCGFGGLSNYIAENYDCKVTAANISTEQLVYANKHKPNANVEFFCTDYRDIDNYNPQHIKFDKIVTVGLCEHIGYKNYKSFMQLIREQLKDDGLVLLHTIGKNDSIVYRDAWINKYIFPGGILPSIKRLAEAAEGNLIIEDIHNFGADYDKTLMAWYYNFKAAWPDLKDKYGERFYRMWEYYLLSCAGAFRSRDLALWQFVFSPKGVLNGYRSIR